MQATVLELLKELQRERGFACLFITHDLAVVDALADRIAVMRHGELVEVGSREQILRYPREQYTQRLLAAVRCPIPPFRTNVAYRASRPSRSRTTSPRSSGRGLR